VEEPLLAAVIPNEPETPIADEPLNRSVRHFAYLRGSRPHDPVGENPKSVPRGCFSFA
jgi:hypothetical protein